MPIIPIELPAGMMRNGTPYAARGRWVDGNLVRWHDGSLRPIGGWSQRQTIGASPLNLPTDEVVRDGIPYRTNSGNVESVYFSNKRVFRMDSGNQITEVTPLGYPQTPSTPTVTSGYGVGPYGAEPYGVRRTEEASFPEPVGRIASDMWGENVLFAVNNEGPIYEYTPAGVAAEIATAPSDVADVVVTDQRIVMTIKNSPEIRQVIWSDREDNTEWTETVSNYAGSRVLQGSGNLLGLYKVLNQVLILSETDAHVARFLGAPFVYGFERVGTGCAPIWPSAVVKTDRFAMWWGLRNFWMYDGTLRPVPCEVMDYITNDINPDVYSKVHTTVISDFSEVWWFYQSISGSEIDSYVVFDYVENHWSTGRLSRTFAFDRGVYENPIMVNVAGDIINHELPSVKVDGEAFASTGPLELQNGQKNMAVRYVFPDTEQKGSVELEFKTRQMPTEPDVAFGPYTYENPISTTGLMGREVRMQVNGLTNNWEVGVMRFDVQVVGGGYR